MFRICKYILAFTLLLCATDDSLFEQEDGEASTSRPKDAKHFGDHWYKVFKEKKSWHDSKRACEALGGQLVCIESAEEQAFIEKLTDGDYYYLGATDENKEGHWRWINGHKFAYQHWYEGQPNNYGGDEHYLATYDKGEWVDVAAQSEGFWMPVGYICEWER